MASSPTNGSPNDENTNGNAPQPAAPQAVSARGLDSGGRAQPAAGDQPAGYGSSAVDDVPHGPLNSAPGGERRGDAMLEGEEYIDGFGWRTVFGALFIGFVMMPGAIYLGLMAGQGMGPAAEWVTIILFLEVARRSYQSLKKQEIYLLYYIGASLTQAVGALALTGGVFAGLIMNTYIVNTPIAHAFGITQGVPNWAVPPPDSEALLRRTFVDWVWAPAVGLILFTQLFGRMQTWGLGYVMFRLTSDVERLPFPLAPIAAEGATALAESSSQEEGWRWRVFSIGAMLGVGWGALYILLPAVTGLVFAQPITIVSIPFIDLTANTQKIMPASLSAIGTDPGMILVGFVLPYAIVIGTAISSIGCFIVGNPILYHYGYLPQWTPGIDLIQTQLITYFDFWLSIIIGVSAVVAIIGIGSVIRALTKKNEGEARGARLKPPPGRGDISIWLSLLLWAVGTAAYVAMCQYLVPDFPLWILLFFGFVWTPIFSYINARMAGMAGTGIAIPYVKEASFMLARYDKVDIWFAPIPLADYGFMAQHFRTVELTRTKFISIVKAELLMLPIMLFCSFLFWNFIWRLSPIPSAQYPYAAKFWPAHAQTQVLWWTANRAGSENFLLQAINVPYIMAGAGISAALYGIIALSGMPILLFYGLVNGVLGQAPYGAILMLIGALLGKHYFARRYGRENWQSYAPVLVAGYYCGMGLIGMGSVALALLSKSVSRLPF